MISNFSKQLIFSPYSTRYPSLLPDLLSWTQVGLSRPCQSDFCPEDNTLLATSSTNSIKIGWGSKTTKANNKTKQTNTVTCSHAAWSCSECCSYAGSCSVMIMHNLLLQRDRMNAVAEIRLNVWRHCWKAYSDPKNNNNKKPYTA